jgi:hypothetical protein
MPQKPTISLARWSAFACQEGYKAIRRKTFETGGGPLCVDAAKKRWSGKKWTNKAEKFEI